MILNESNKKNAVVVLIDSGIDGQKCNLDKYIGYSTTYKLGLNGKVIEDKNHILKHEHGTAISMVIKSMCEDVEFICLNILDENLQSDGRVLLHAMKKALVFKPDVIHCSLGTSSKKYWFSLSRYIWKARKQGTFIVAAKSNNGEISYPAHIRGVIKVAGSMKCNAEKLYYLENTFYAPFGLEGIEGNEELVNASMAGNSIAAAYITGYICNLKMQNKMNEIFSNTEMSYL